MPKYVYKRLKQIQAENRVEQLRAMHMVMRCANDENFYMRWIVLVPDCPSNYDFECIAKDDEEYNEVVDLFFNILDGKKEDFKI